jgi:signal transduction histidine kinase
MYIGAMLALRALEFWSSDDIVFSSAFLAFGIAAMWDRSDPAARTKIARLTGAGEPETTRIRVIGGGLLMLTGFAVFVGSIDALAGIGPVLFAVALTIAGFMILFGPLVWRMGRDLAEERRSRIRSDERAEMAAHLHDSVLQTLALIQRTDDPKKMVTLARGQERELRDWLYGKGRTDGAVELSEAVREQASRVERDHDIPVDVVVVGDAPLDDSLNALAQAAGEAMTNAAKHSGAGKVSVYVEVTGDAAEIYVGDTGAGFDRAEIEGLGRGIDHSISARMTRHGGEARIISERGEGTEVELRMPRAT